MCTNNDCRRIFRTKMFELNAEVAMIMFNYYYWPYTAATETFKENIFFCLWLMDCG